MMGYQGHTYKGRNYIGHNYIGHDYIGHNYIGHNCTGNYTYDGPQCVWFDRDQQQFRTEGCKRIGWNSSTNEVTCRCTHLTDFALYNQIKQNEDNMAKCRTKYGADVGQWSREKLYQKLLDEGTCGQNGRLPSPGVSPNAGLPFGGTRTRSQTPLKRAVFGGQMLQIAPVF